MAQKVHSLAPHHLPGFLPTSDGSDFLFAFVVVLVIAIVLGLGVLYFTVHALPEKMGHKANSTQLQLIGILSLLALFTHNNLFWVLALLLAAVRLPDFMTPLRSISQSLENLRFREPALCAPTSEVSESSKEENANSLKPIPQSGEMTGERKVAIPSPVIQPRETAEKQGD